MRIDIMKMRNEQSHDKKVADEYASNTSITTPSPFVASGIGQGLRSKVKERKHSVKNEIKKSFKSP
jgi:hypothetical protein|tara:strand:+ start:945 stop:1142 length:198 start_codon:yes stop_codon:yes gene_type:complete